MFLPFHLISRASRLYRAPLHTSHGHGHVGEELHLDLVVAVAAARLAPPALDVERESARLVAADAGLGGRGEQLTHRREGAGVGCGIAAGRPSDGGLVDVDDLVDVADALNGIEEPRAFARPVELLGQLLVENLVDEGALAGAGHARYAHEHAERYLYVDAFEVIFARTPHDQGLAVAFSGEVRQGDAFAIAEVLAGEGLGGLYNFADRSGGDDVSAVLAGAGAHVDDVVCRAHDGLVVLDDEDGVAEVAETEQGLDEAVVVCRMEADGRLVADVEDAYEARTYLRGQADALGLTAAEGRCGTFKGQVVEADVVEEAQARLDLLEGLRGDGHFALGQRAGVAAPDGLAVVALGRYVVVAVPHGHGDDVRRLRRGTVGAGAVIPPSDSDGSVPVRPPVAVVSEGADPV